MSRQQKTVRIIATSDLHGKMVPWLYALNEEDRSGSTAQLASAIRQYRTENCIVADAGDLIQDNSAELFLDDPVHPMVQAMNRMNYDIWVTGNHEYNFGMEAVKKTIRTLDALTLTGNVYLEDGSRLAPAYTIIERGGIRVALIGMTSSNIQRWDVKNLAACRVTDALEETRKVIEEIKGSYDVLVGVYHMTIENECCVANTGVQDICEACPEFDLMISSHGHQLIRDRYINNVLVIQNQMMCQSMFAVDLVFEQENGAWKLTERIPQYVNVGEFECDPEMMKLMEPYHKRALADAAVEIGVLKGGPLAPEEEIRGIPEALLGNTALIDLVQKVQLYYSGADVSATGLFDFGANLEAGPIRKCDASRIYRFPNNLYRVRMNGKQLKQFMEWSARYYNTFHPGDLSVSFNKDIRYFFYMIFSGVNYEINIGKEAGSRIEHLSWPDGSPVKETDSFTVAANDYCANASLLNYGEIFREGDELPTLEEADIRSDLGGIRELVKDYIRNVKQGIITPEHDNNWKLTGYSWDQELRETAVRLSKEGKLQAPAGSAVEQNVRALTSEDLEPFIRK